MDPSISLFMSLIVLKGIVHIGKMSVNASILSKNQEICIETNKPVKVSINIKNCINKKYIENAYRFVWINLFKYKFAFKFEIHYMSSEKLQ